MSKIANDRGRTCSADAFAPVMVTPTVRSTLDVACIVLYAIGATAAILWLDPATPVRIVLGVPLLLFVPGYALIAGLYPQRHMGASVSRESPISRPKETSDGLSIVGRLSLSVAASLAVVPTIAFVLNFAAGGIALRPVLLATSAITAALGLLAVVNRHRLPPDGRFRVAPRARVAGAYNRYVRSEADGLSGVAPFESSSRRETVLNALLVVSVLALLGSVAVAVTVPDRGQSFTEFYLVSENESGEFVAASPAAVEAGAAVYPTIANEEGEELEYTVVATVETVEREGGETRVVERRELDRFTASVPDGETARLRHDVDAAATGPDRRLTYLLYVGDPPSDPSRENAYRTVHVWTTAEAGADG